MDRKKVDKILNWSAKILFSLLFILMVASVANIEVNKKSPEEIASILKTQKENLAKIAQGKPLNENIPDPWPPKMNKPYPEIELIDQDGKEFKISDLKGKVIVLSFLDMSSPVSQAQSGALLSGAYGLTQELDKTVDTFDDALRKAIDVDFSLPNEDVIEVSVIVYTQDGGQASVDDAKNWADHFNLSKDNGEIVAVPKKDIRGEESDKIINGFQLIDKNNILRVDSSGPEPKHNLRMTLVPLLPKLLR